jgi:hypothetical protein
MKKKPEAAPSTMTELRDDLCDLYFDARNGLLKTEFIKESANVAGKIIKSAVAQNEYSIARKEKPEIPFMK